MSDLPIPKHFELFQDDPQHDAAVLQLQEICIRGKAAIEAGRLDQLKGIYTDFRAVQNEYSQAGAGDSEPRAIVGGYLQDVAQEDGRINIAWIYELFRY
jgi:hypothetical protein